jgi:cytochrome c-type biogenesis protein CcmH/NrfG
LSVQALIFEEHSSVLAHWWREPARARTLIYLDAHLDLQYVNPERIRRLEQCRSAEEVAALAKPHDLWPDRQFSYSIEDFLYPAARLGLVNRLVWVAPPHVGTGYSERVVDQLRQMDGVSPEDLMSFRRVAGRIEGRLLGLDLTVCGLDQLEGIPLPPESVIDIDVDYFVAVPGDRSWIDPAEVIGVLRRLPRASDCLTISLSVGSGFTPLRHRFLGEYLAALWEDRPGEAKHYARLFELERRLRAGEREAAAQALKAEAARHPDCAATWYLLGLGQRDPVEAAHCQARAAAISPAYAPSVVRSACEIRHRRLSTDLAYVMRLERELARVPEGERGLAFAALGLLWCAFGELGRAQDCYRRARESLGSQSELAMQIAKLLLRAGKTGEAASFLSAALEDDKARSAARGYLARLFCQSGRLKEARIHLEEAHKAAPCWREPLEALMQLYRQLGEDGAARRLEARLAEEQERQHSLSRRLAAGP